MKKNFRIRFILLGGLILLVISAYISWYNPKFTVPTDSRKPKPGHRDNPLSTLKSRAETARDFISAKGLSKEYCFLIDMQIPSGRNRFFVYDLKNDSVVREGLVAHGSCDAGFSTEPEFSNRVNSGCSCTGRFRIGNAYDGQFGTAYKLHGLDSSNSNAFSRYIVLHAYDCVPEDETDPVPICNSRGCPMVSYGFLNELRNYIGAARQPVLLWIFDGNLQR